jgi:hypothetical protein
MSMIIPDDLKLVNASMASPAIVDRESITLYPTGDNTVESGRNTIQSGRIEFKIPVNSRKSWDCSTMFIHFNFRIVLQNGVGKTAATNLTRIHVHDSIESIVKTVTVDLAGGAQRLEYIDNYNSLETALNFYCSSDYVKSFGAACMRAGLHSHVRNRIYHKFQNATTFTGASEITNQFTMPLRLSGISSPDFVLPSSLFGSGGFVTITIDLESPHNCIVAGQEAITYTAGGAITAGTTFQALTGISNIFYELSNIRMTLDAITYSAEYENMLANALASSKLVYPIKTFDIQARQIASGSTRYTENLSFNYSSVNAIFAWFVKSADVNSHLVAGKDRLFFPDNLKDVQFRVNGMNVPTSRPIDCTGGATEAYVHLLEALGVLHTAEQYGGLNYDQCVHNVTYNSASNADHAITASYASSDIFYGKNRDSRYGLPVSLTDTGDETTGPEVIPVAGSCVTTLSSPLPYNFEMSPSHFLIGVNLKKLLRSAPGEISGENLAVSSGQIQYELNFSSTNNTSWIMYVAVLHDRFIELSNQSVNVRF